MTYDEMMEPPGQALAMRYKDIKLSDGIVRRVPEHITVEQAESVRDWPEAGKPWHTTMRRV